MEHIQQYLEQFSKDETKLKAFFEQLLNVSTLSTTEAQAVKHHLTETIIRTSLFWTVQKHEVR